MRPSFLASITIISFLLIGSTTLADPVASADSTEVREPSSPGQSLGDVLLKLPGYVLYAPFFVLEKVSSGIVHVVAGTGGGPNIIQAFIDPTRPVAPMLSYSGQAGLIGGVRLVRKPAFDARDRLRIKATYSIFDYSLFDVKYRNPSLAGGRFGLTGNATYSRSPRESFYGLGNDTRKSQQTSYTIEETLIRGDLFWRPLENIEIGGFAAGRTVGVFDGHNFNFENNLSAIRERFDLAPEDTRSTQFVSVGALLDLDYRDHIGQPSSGGRLLAEVSFNSGIGDDENLEFTRTRVELQQFVDVWHKRIFAFRAVVQDIDRSEGVSPNPIYLLSSLGGQSTLRSYQSARFVDRDMALFTFEYRYPVWDVIDAFLFLDEGRVFDQIGTNFSWRNWRHSVGFGLRVWTEDEVIGLVTIATGKEGTRFSFQLGEVF